MNSMNMPRGGGARLLYLVTGLTYWALASIFHLKVSLFLISPMLPGRSRPADYIWNACLILGALLLTWVMGQFIRKKIGIPFVIITLLWVLAALAANRFLVSTTNEYVHYPQYAVTAFFLHLSLRTETRPLPVSRVLFWATLLGVIDEAVQYFYICPSYGEYLDFNDFILNQLGAGAGIILAASFGKGRGPSTARPSLGIHEAVALTALAMALSAAVYWGNLKITPPRDIPPGGLMRMQEGTTVFLERRPGVMGSWQKAQAEGIYYVLTSFEGTALMVLIMTAAVILESLSFYRSRP